MYVRFRFQIPLEAAVDFVARNWFFNSLCIEDVVVVTAAAVLMRDLTFPVFVIAAIVQQAADTMVQDSAGAVTLQTGGFEVFLRALQLQPLRLHELLPRIDAMISDSKR